MTTLEKLITKWESEKGSYILNSPIYGEFINEAKQYLENEKRELKRAYLDGIVDGKCEQEVSTDEWYRKKYLKKSTN